MTSISNLVIFVINLIIIVIFVIITIIIIIVIIIIIFTNFIVFIRFTLIINIYFTIIIAAGFIIKKIWFIVCSNITICVLNIEFIEWIPLVIVSGTFNMVEFCRCLTNLISNVFLSLLLRYICWFFLIFDQYIGSSNYVII